MTKYVKHRKKYGSESGSEFGLKSGAGLYGFERLAPRLTQGHLIKIRIRIGGPAWAFEEPFNQFVTNPGLKPSSDSNSNRVWTVSENRNQIETTCKKN